MKIKELYSEIHHLFSIQDRPNSGEWLAILSGIEGALLCLDRAKCFEGDRDKWVEAADALASKLYQNELVNENDYPAWFSGFYLNNAELRISSALHRMIKAFLKEDSGIIWELIKKISPEQIPQIKVLKGARKKKNELRDNYEIKTEEACIARVWRRTNEIKHKNRASFDDEDPNIRYLDSINSVEFILKLYRELLDKSSKETP